MVLPENPQSHPRIPLCVNDELTFEISSQRQHTFFIEPLRKLYDKYDLSATAVYRGCVSVVEDIPFGGLFLPEEFFGHQHYISRERMPHRLYRATLHDQSVRDSVIASAANDFKLLRLGDNQIIGPYGAKTPDAIKRLVGLDKNVIPKYPIMSQDQGIDYSGSSFYFERPNVPKVMIENAMQDAQRRGTDGSTIWIWESRGVSHLTQSMCLLRNNEFHVSLCPEICYDPTKLLNYLGTTRVLSSSTECDPEAEFHIAFVLKLNFRSEVAVLVSTGDLNNHIMKRKKFTANILKELKKIGSRWQFETSEHNLTHESSGATDDIVHILLSKFDWKSLNTFRENVFDVVVDSWLLEKSFGDYSRGQEDQLVSLACFCSIVCDVIGMARTEQAAGFEFFDYVPEEQWEDVEMDKEKFMDYWTRKDDDPP